MATCRKLERVSHPARRGSRCREPASRSGRRGGIAISGGPPGYPLPVTDGVVVGMGLHDELSGDMFAAIRTTGGQGLLPAVAAAGRADAARAGRRPPRVRGGALAEAGGPDRGARRSGERRNLRSSPAPARAGGPCRRRRRSSRSAKPGGAGRGEYPSPRTARTLPTGLAIARWALADSQRPSSPSSKAASGRIRSGDSVSKSSLVRPEAVCHTGAGPASEREALARTLRKSSASPMSPTRPNFGVG